VKTLRCLALAAFLLLLALPAGAEAARWRSIGALTPHDKVEAEWGLTSVADGGGDFTALFRVYTGTDADQPGPVMYGDRPAGGALGAPMRFPYEVRSPRLPVLAVGPGGERLAAWADFEINRFTFEASPASVLVSTRPKGGNWSAPQVLADRLPRVDDVQIAAAPNGEAVVVWETVEGAPWRPETPRTVSAAARAAGASSFDPAAELGDGVLSRPTIALDDQGNGLVAWGERDKGIRVARHRAGDGFTAAQTLAVAGLDSPREPQLAVASGGRAVVAWVDDAASGQSYPDAIAAAVGTATAGFGKPHALELAADGWAPGVAIDDRVATVVWQAGRGRHSRLRAVILRSGQALEKQPKRTLARRSFVAQPSVARGRATFAWTGSNGLGIVRARSATADGVFTRPHRLSSRRDRSGYVVVHADRHGNPFVAWSGFPRHSHGPDRIQAAKASRRTGRFARTQTVARGQGSVDFIELFPGAGGSMLLVYHGSYWGLRAYGER
jgi:hypothetical protein